VNRREVDIVCSAATTQAKALVGGRQPFELHLEINLVHKADGRLNIGRDEAFPEKVENGNEGASSFVELHARLVETRQARRRSQLPAQGVLARCQSQ
jgi:hypothetical protein